MDTNIFVLDYQFANPIAMDRALEIVEEFIDLNKDGTLDYTVKEIIRSIDENFYNGLGSALFKALPKAVTLEQSFHLLLFHKDRKRLLIFRRSILRKP